MTNISHIDAARVSKEKVSNSEIVDMLLKNPLKSIGAIQFNSRTELVSVTGNLVSSIDTDILEATVSVFLLRWFDVVGQKAKNLFKTALHQIKLDQNRRVHDVQSIAYSDEGVMAWVILDRPSRPVTIEDLPEFKLFLGQTTPESQKAIVMWLGSLLDPNSSRRQYLHLQGAGGEGKGTLIESLQTAFVNRAISISAAQINRPHFGVELEGMRLYIFGDENNSTFFSNGTFKGMTGDDYMSVNPKNKDVRTIKLTGKALVCSNSLMQLEDNFADRSRAIPINLSNTKKPLGWRDGFIAKALGMLLFCHSEYLKELAINPGIQQELPTVLENVNSAVDRKIEAYIDVFNDCFSIESGYKTLRSALNKTIIERCPGEKPSVIRQIMAAYLTSKGVIAKNTNGGNYYYVGLRQLAGETSSKGLG